MPFVYTCVHVRAHVHLGNKNVFKEHSLKGRILEMDPSTKHKPRT
jgi:hypothetical protein